MAYNYYAPYGYQPQQYQIPMQNVPQNNQPVQQQPNRSDFVLVRSEDEARNYPVAFGNTVTFKHENEPYMYTKTMGMSQLDRPVFERYKLVKEAVTEQPQKPVEPKCDNGIVEKLEREIGAIWNEIELLKKPKVAPTKKVGEK